MWTKYKPDMTIPFAPFAHLPMIHLVQNDDLTNLTFPEALARHREEFEKHPEKFQDCSEILSMIAEMVTYAALKAGTITKKQAERISQIQSEFYQLCLSKLMNIKLHAANCECEFHNKPQKREPNFAAQFHGSDNDILPKGE